MQDVRDCCGITDLAAVVTAAAEGGTVQDPLMFHRIACEGGAITARWQDRLLAVLETAPGGFMIEGGGRKVFVSRSDPAERLVGAWRVFVRHRLLEEMGGLGGH